MARNPDNVAIPGALVFRVDAALLYFNVQHVHDVVWAKIRSNAGPLRLVLCDLSTSANVDVAGARMLASLHAELKAAGIEFRMASAHGDARDILRAEGLEARAGYFGRRVSAVDVLDEFQALPAR
jgi:MFS superfamily sulfate permease-like transporter